MEELQDTTGTATAFLVTFLKMRAVVVLLTLWVTLLPGQELKDATAKLEAGDSPGAIQILQALITKDPGAVRPSALLTEVLLGMERIDEADAAVSAALSRNPDASYLHSALGDVRLREGQINLAEAEYKTAFRLDQKNPRALYGVARIFQTAAINHKAALLIRDAYGINPSDEQIEEALERVENQTEASVARWEQALGSLPKNDDSAMARGLRARIAEAKKLGNRQPFELVKPYGHFQVPLNFLMNGTRFTGFGVNISVNDAKDELRLDTGAGGILLSSRTAERAGVERLADINLGGIGNAGPKDGWLGYAEHIQIGNVEFQHCIVRVRAKGSVDDSGGLVGTDVFRRFMVKLDFFNKRIDLDPLPGPAWDGYTPVDRYTGAELNDFAQFYRVGHDILIPTRISDGPPVLFLVDTGAGLVSISTNAAPNVTKLRDDNYMKVKGISGNVRNVYKADKVVIQFANFRQQIDDMTSFDLTGISRNAGVEVTGIMGVPLLLRFRSITLDYRDGRIKFEYKP